MTFRRFLRSFHRRVGAALCLPVLVWFLSGIVMTFAGFPSIDETERLSRARPLSAEMLVVAPSDVFAAVQPNLDSVVLEAFGGRALYRAHLSGKTIAVLADNGERVSLLDQRLVEAESAAWLGSTLSRTDRVEEVDQWTPQANRGGELPFLRVRAADEDSTELYVSLTDARVVQKTTGTSRLLAWVGAIPHWVYPIQLRRHPGTWRAVVITLASLGGLATLAGLVHGLSVARFARRSARGQKLSVSPFRRLVLAWHHVLGLIFGAASLTWLLSGILSFHPLGASTSSEPTALDSATFRGGDLAPATFSRSPADALRECRVKLNAPIKRIEFARAGGAAFYVCKTAGPATCTVSATDADPGRSAPSPSEIAELSLPLGYGAGMTLQFWLTAGDAYYYRTHHSPDLPFPVLRTDFSDGRRTYVNPSDLAVVRSYPPGAKPQRWLYHGLHSWDVPWLYRHRLLWRAAILTALALGAALAATALVLSVGKLRRARS